MVQQDSNLHEPTVFKSVTRLIELTIQSFWSYTINTKCNHFFRPVQVFFCNIKVVFKHGCHSWKLLRFHDFSWQLLNFLDQMSLTISQIGPDKALNPPLPSTQLFMLSASQVHCTWIEDWFSYKPNITLLFSFTNNNSTNTTPFMSVEFYMLENSNRRGKRVNMYSCIYDPICLLIFIICNMLFTPWNVLFTNDN